MSLIPFALALAALAAFVFAVRHFREQRAQPDAGRPLASDAKRTAAPLDEAGAAKIRAHVPDLEALQWSSPPAPGFAPAKPKAGVERIRPHEEVPGAFAGSDLEEKIRSRYIGLRFPGISRAGLSDSERVIQAARLFFEEEQPDKALELLDLAIEERSTEEGLRLAQIEIAFLERDARRYCALARELRRALPEVAAWPEVARLGRLIAPGEAMFGGEEPERVNEHYGPWPDMPNWIHAPWDLTAEVHASDFHRAMAQATKPGMVHLPHAA